jgi:hypothetical protein
MLLVASTYAVMVTFSRAGYLGFGLAVVVSAGLCLARSGGAAGPGWLKRGAGAVALLLAAAVAAPVFLGGFAQERLARAGQDLEVRLAHWRDALAMRDPGIATQLFGMGLGRFPATHYWRSGETRAAGYQLGQEGESRFLRLGTGSPVYVEQLVPVVPGQTYTLSLRARSPAGMGRIAVSLCEKWLLTSARCVFAGQEVAGAGWQTVSLVLPAGEVGSGPWYRARPIKLSVYNPGRAAVVEVDDLRLATRDGRDLLANGDFSAGMDRWFFSADVDLPWHVWSLPVAVLFEMGWAGVAACFGLVLVGGGRAVRWALRGNPLGAAVVAAIAGLGVISLTSGTCVDSPRFVLLVTLLALTPMGRVTQHGVRP